MGNRVSITGEPTVMTKTFLHNVLMAEISRTEGLNIDELKKLVQTDGLEQALVLSLQLENLNLLNISYLWKFALLTKLNLSSNYIEVIEGMDCLSNLSELDLSFNCIKHIKGLNGLVNLTFLNLSSNGISVLENMKCLSKLESFYVRSNKLETFSNVYYLSQFPNLFSLGIGDNPMMNCDSSDVHTIAILPQLKFLDFTLVTQVKLKIALEKYKSQQQKCADDLKTLSSNIGIEIFSPLWKKDISDKEAFVDGLANGRGFEIFMESNKNFQLLHSFPLVAEIALNHKLQVGFLFDEWHRLGRQYYMQMLEEKKEFVAMVKNTENFISSTLDEEFNRYVTAKEEIPKRFCLILQQQESVEKRDKEIEDFKSSSYGNLFKTYKRLMSVTSMFVDLTYELGRIFSTEIEKIRESYLEDVEKLVNKISEVNEKYILQMKESYFKLLEGDFDFDSEQKDEDGNVTQVDPVLRKLLSRKDFIDMALNMTRTIHSTLLSGRVEKLDKFLSAFASNATTSVLESEVLDEQNEQIRNAVVFCSKQKFVLDGFFAAVPVFKKYLGYD